MELNGVNHVTAVTGDAPANVKFYTDTLGLRLVKKSVNQDDVSAYHLFYADKLGTPGTDMTFFDWAQTGTNVRGTDAIVNTMFRVNGRAALEYWAGRFNELNVPNSGITSFAGRAVLPFEDFEGQRMTLVDDEGADFEGEVWDGASIPVEHAIRGFYGVRLSIPNLSRFAVILTDLLGFKEQGQHADLENPDQMVTIYSMAGGGAGKEVHVIEQPQERAGYLGRGGVHHVAFRVKDERELSEWFSHLSRIGVGTSGLIDRFYFKSLYFRVSNGILFELATDGPGFDVDEPLESLGERLALPPFLEPRRAQIEAGLKPL